MGNLYNRREKIKLVPSRVRYPGLKALLKQHGYTYRAVYLRMEKMRPDVFTNIVNGAIPEVDGFLEVTLEILKLLGIDATEAQLKKIPEEPINI